MGQIKPKKPRAKVECRDIQLKDGTMVRVRGTGEPTEADLETLEAFAAFLRSQSG